LTHAPGPKLQDAFLLTALGDRKAGLFSDLRGYYARRFTRFSLRPSQRQRSLEKSPPNWVSVRNFGEELARLAARLLSSRGDGDFSVEDLENGFETTMRRTRRRRQAIWGLVSMAFLALVGVLADRGWTLAEEQKL